MSDNKQLDARRAHGSHAASLAEAVVKREKLVRELVTVTEAINRHFRACVAAEAVDRSITPEIPPARRDGVTPLHAVPALDERAPHQWLDMSGVMAAEQAQRDEQRQRDEEQWRRNPPPRVPDTSVVPGGL